MPGSGTQQIAKAAEDMGANRVLFECADPQIIEALIGKNVEVIEPEGDHHLAQLPRFEYRPINPRRHRLLNHDARGPARGFDYRRIRLDAHHRHRRSKLGEKLGRRHPQRIELRDSLGQRRRLGQRLRMKLLRQPRLRLQARDSLEIAGAWTEGKTVNQVQRLFCDANRAHLDYSIVPPGGPLLFCREARKRAAFIACDARDA